MNFLVKNFSKVFLLISLLTLFYVIFQSEIFWKGTQRDYYLKYYLFSILLLIFSGISYFLHDKIKRYLLTFFLCAFSSVYLFEFYASYTDLKEIKYKEEIFEKNTNENFDKRSRFQVYEELKSKNKNLQIYVPPSTWLKKKDNIGLFPLSGISNSETLHCNENGYYSRFKSDRYGFNNPDFEWNSEQIEYLIIGDSYPFGACVNRPEDISSVLRKISKKNILNLSNAGSGSLIQYATLREYLRPGVKNIVWMFYGNDLDDLNSERDSLILNNYIKDLSFTQNLKNKQIQIEELLKAEIDKVFYKEQKTNNNFKIPSFIKLYKFRSLIKSLRKQKKYNYEEFNQIIRLAKSLAEKNNSNFYLVYLPRYSDYKNKFNMKLYKDIKKISQKNKIGFIDLHELVFKINKNPLNFFPFGKAGHYNEKGYEASANAIHKLIDNR